MEHIVISEVKIKFYWNMIRIKIINYENRLLNLIGISQNANVIS